MKVHGGVDRLVQMNIVLYIITEHSCFLVAITIALSRPTTSKTHVSLSECGEGGVEEGG